MQHDEASLVEAAEKQIFNEKPDLSTASIVRYARTRLTTLLDVPVRNADRSVWEILNPLPGLKEVTPLGWNFYFLGFFGWTIDAMDFFCVSVSAPQIAATLGVSIADITWGVTLVLMLRSVGAAIFGILADYYGRKWTFIFVCVCFTVIEIGTGFVQTYSQFLGVRALFGVFMGAFYPLCSNTALEDQPVNARSVLSGLFLPGYNFGYLLASVFYRAFENSYKDGEGWRSLFWFTAGPPVILVVWRLFYPETAAFLRLKEQKKIVARSQQQPASGFGKYFDRSILTTIKTEWVLFVYLIFLMSGFNFMSHGTQDLYPTMLRNQRHVTPNQQTIIMVVVNLGAMCGGIFFGQLTELLGRRLTIIVCALFAGCFLYPSFFVDDLPTITGCYFFLNFGVMGAWGVAPLHLLELVNATHRSFLSGVVYQLGNLASSASITIEAQLGTKFPIKAGGTSVYDYGKVMGIFSGAVFAYMIVIVFIGPERFHRDITIHVDRGSIRVDSDSEVEEQEVAGKEKV